MKKLSLVFILLIPSLSFGGLLDLNEAAKSAAAISAVRRLMDELNIHDFTTESLRRTEERINSLSSKARRIESKYQDLSEVLSGGNSRSKDIIGLLEEATEAVKTINDLYSLIAPAGPEVVTMVSSIDNGQYLKRIIENQNRQMLLIEEHRLEEQVQRARSVERFRDFIRRQRRKMYE